MPNYYDLPPDELGAEPGSKEAAILEWCDARLIDGIKFVESSIGYDKVDMVMSQMFSNETASSASYIPNNNPLSKTRANLMSPIAEDVVAMLTDTRCFWTYGNQNPKYQEQNRIANKQTGIWYNKNLVDLRIGDVIRYYTAAGTGYAHLYYSKRIDDFLLEAEDPRNVFPIDPISYHTVQDAKGVIIRRPRTPAWIKEEYGKIVAPDDETIGRFFGWIKRVIDGPAAQGGPLTKKSKGDKITPGIKQAFVNTMYLHDPRLNETKETQYMGKWKDGKPLTPWSYKVKPDYPLYPLKRLIVWGGKRLLHDGPSWAWHGKYPLTKFTLNPWPGAWFGKAPMWDCLPLQQSIDRNLRVIDDHAEQVAQPGAVGDRNVSKAEMNKLNTRQAGYKIRTNMAAGKGIMIQTPPPLDPIIWEVVKWCDDKMKIIAGTVDLSNISSLNQLPSDDTIDTIMKAMTPGIRLRSRLLEGCYKEIAEQVMWLQFEFDTLSKREAALGPNGVTKEDFDYLPGDMIPDNIPDGEPGDVANRMMEAGLEYPMPRYDRAKLMLQSWGTTFDPSSLLNTAAREKIMEDFLLAKMGYLSVFTLMERMGRTNFAPPGLAVPDDEIGRLALQSQLGIGMIANAQGRKATNSAAPSMGQSGGGPIIQTS